MTLHLRAPGKLVVLGEYAVLDGAPAIVAAVDRGVQVYVSPHPMRHITVPEGSDDRFVRAALAAIDAPARHYAFLDWRPVGLPPPAKLGIGGSAAAVVAAVAAGHLAAGREVPAEERLRQAIAVHREVQGSGSGIDVVASTMGGTLRVEGELVRSLPPVQPSVVYSGTSAATGPRVARYLAWSDRTAFVRRSSEIVDGFEADPVRALARGCEALRAMAEAADLPYWTDAIDVIAALARAHGGAAKPSGAGGGDVVIALFDAPKQRASFEGAAAAAGFAVVDVEVAPGCTIADR